ncbi:11748_t:CDS:1, partial [Gigaspora rosea]
SFHSSNRRIETKLLKIMQYNSLLNVLSSRVKDRLQTCLQFIEQEMMSYSLSIYNGNDYQEFLSMSVSIKDNAETGSEPFSDELLGPKKECVTLPKELFASLVAYYNNAYNYNNTFLTDILEYPDAITILP